jgi:Skp family chaperone for outer membrane proteins
MGDTAKLPTVNAPGIQENSQIVLRAIHVTIQFQFQREREARMKLRWNAAATAILAACLIVSFSDVSGQTPQTTKHTAARRAKVPQGPSVQEQIDTLRQQMQSQIDSLKSDLATKDTELQQAKQAAADAQAAAAKAEADATAQQQAFTENSQAVSTLQSTVTDLKANQASLADTVSTETTSIKQQIMNPDAIYFKGVTLSPTGSFLAAETVDRTAATGGDINTPFTGVPLQNSQAYQLSEFFGSGRQSRAALKATGKLSSVTLTGYYEADWLSSGTTSNNNQSNSYTLRQRQLWGDAKTSSGWDFSGGQGWSLVTETTQGLTRGTEILPSTIDAQYEAGFVWTRQESFRMTKDFGKSFFMGASIENAETLNPGGQNTPSNYLFGSTGTNGGLYNTTANYSFNYTPDFVVKIAAQPGWGHWELFGIERNFRDRIYPCATVSSTCTVPTTATPYNSTAIGAGIGGGFRAPLAGKYASIGLKGLWGQGVGRYGSSTIDDITLRPDATISPIHGFSALSTLELNPAGRFMAYFNYGGDELDRDYVLSTVGATTTQVGYGTRSTNMSGCLVEPTTPTAGATGAAPTAPSNCGGSTKDVQEFTAGYWWNIIAGAKGRLRQGIQYSLIRRDIWSGAGGTANPGNGAHGDDNMIFTSLRYYLP